MFGRRGHLNDKELVGFLDGEISHRAANYAQKHLAECSECRSRKREFEDVTANISRLNRASIAAPVEFESAPHYLIKLGMDAAPKLKRGLLSATPLTGPEIYLYAAIAVAVLSCNMFDWQGHLFDSSHMPQLETRLRPDSGLTPGVTRPVSLSEICNQQDGDLDPDVSPTIKQAIFKEYGITDAPANDYQVDYLINPQLGGTADLGNLWPEPNSSKVWNAHLKDALEDHLHVMVCNQQIDLASAQRAIASDWIAAYKKYVQIRNHA
ncbi:anti-sigma factor family protein [Granulicella arctica]|uniref:anti-sigma factor family protein n=1 Tax=Granulicella arctica TaxID=940613 RepID=UPI0021DFA59D|nr:zf-HC2 domain-containing protein [Granulicella arctica]